MRMHAKIIPTGRLPVRIRTQTGARCITSHYDPGIVPTLAELNGYAYCGHSVLMGRIQHLRQDVEKI